MKKYEYLTVYANPTIEKTLEYYQGWGWEPIKIDLALDKVLLRREKKERRKNEKVVNN